jgi:molecular chaperone HscA
MRASVTLGGDDFDACVVRWFCAQQPAFAWRALDAAALNAAARAAKEALSLENEVEMRCERRDGVAQVAQLTRELFEAETQALVQRTIAPLRRALRDAVLKPAEIEGIVMVGGATRMPQVRLAVTEFFGREPYTDVDPDQAVALGAAIQADHLAGHRALGGDGLLLLDVCPLSLGLETMGGLAEKIPPRNTTVPTARAQEFTTFKHGQTAMSLHVVQGERELVSECRSLARFTLRGIPPTVAGAARIRVTFQIDADGLLSVSASEQSIGVQTHVEVRPSYGLGRDTVARMLRSAIDSAESDAAARLLREAEVEARGLLDAVDRALGMDEAMLLPREQFHILCAMQGVADLLEQCAGDEGSGPTEQKELRDGLRRATEALNATTTAFAARRMNAHVRDALAGRSLTSPPRAAMNPSSAAPATAVADSTGPTSEVTVLPHPDLCPEGLSFSARRGRKLVDELLAAGIAIEHACEKVGACATCHGHVRSGAEFLAPSDDEEEDQLDDAWGLDAQSRLSCCVRVNGPALVIALPLYTKNHARER